MGINAFNKHSQCDIYSGARFVPEKAWHKTITYINAPAVGVRLNLNFGDSTMTNKTAEFILAMVDASSELDKLNSWMLGGTGAAATFLVANVDKSNQLLSSFAAPILLGMLAASALSGFSARYVSAKIDGAKRVMRYSIDNMQDCPPEEAKEMLMHIKDALPWWTHGQIDRDASKGARDGLYGFKLVLRRFEYQKIYVSVQAAILVLCISTAAICALIA